MSHIDHEDSHTAGLCNACPQCLEMARTPTMLDGENLRRIWQGQLKTATDMAAFNTLYRSVVATQRVAEAFQTQELESMPMESWSSAELPERLDQFRLFEVGGRL